MKILQINAVYGISSTGTITKDLHELALAQGIESHVAYSTANVPHADIKNGYKVGSTLGKKLHALCYRVDGRQGYYSHFATARLINHIKKIKPDIVSLHNLHSNYIHLNNLLKFLSKEKIKTVITNHDCWLYTGGCYHYTQIGCYKWQSECGNCPKKKTDLTAYITERTKSVLRDRVKYFNAIEDLTCVGVSDWVTEEAKKSLIKAKRFVTVKNGIDTDFWVDTKSDFRKKHGLENKFVILGLASKFFSDVNRETYERLCSDLKENECLVLLGCNEEQKIGLPKRVMGLEFIKSREELREIYSSADVFANPSREETLSMATVEAQCCGTPAVVYENTGIKETVINGKTGFVVENGNAEEFSKSVGKIKEKGKERFSSVCNKWAAENFDRKKNYHKLIELYKSIV